MTRKRESLLVSSIFYLVFLYVTPGGYISHLSYSPHLPLLLLASYLSTVDNQSVETITFTHRFSSTLRNITE